MSMDQNVVTHIQLCKQLAAVLKSGNRCENENAVIVKKILP